MIIRLHLQVDLPRPKHQTQPLYTAPRMSERLDRVSPLNNRRGNDTASNYHDSKSNVAAPRQLNKNRRQSTNSYTPPMISNSKDLSPTNSLNGSGSYYDGKNKDGLIGTSNSNSKMYTKKLVKRKKTAPHYDNNTNNIILINNKPRINNTSINNTSNNNNSISHR